MDQAIEQGMPKYEPNDKFRDVGIGKGSKDRKVPNKPGQGADVITWLHHGRRGRARRIEMRCRDGGKTSTIMATVTRLDSRGNGATSHTIILRQQGERRCFASVGISDRLRPVYANAYFFLKWLDLNSRSTSHRVPKPGI